MNLKEARALATGNAIRTIEFLMKVEGVDRKELAKRMGVTKSAVTQMLDNNKGISLRTVANALYVLGYTVDFLSHKIPSYKFGKDA